jgi:hypothetical protein
MQTNKIENLCIEREATKQERIMITGGGESTNPSAP